MKIAVVTGYSGFIGSHFTVQLLKDNWIVYGVDKNFSNVNTVEIFSYTNFHYLHDDIRTLKILPDCDYIFNFAAESHVSNSIEDNSEFISTNVEGVRNLLELIRRKPDNVVKKPIFFHISTDEVYGDTQFLPHSETDPLNPSNPYSASKAAADMLILAWARTYNIEYVIARPTNNYGIHQFPEKLIPLSIKLLLWNQKVRLHNGGHPIRCWLHVQDTVSAILTMVNHNVRGIYNISGEEFWTNKMIVKTIMDQLKIYNHEDKLDLSFVRPGQDMKYMVDDKKLRSLGWSCKYTLEENLPHIIQWYIDNPSERLFNIYRR